MQQVDFHMKKHDTAPPLRATLEDEHGAAVDLSTATAVAFHMFPASTFPNGSLKVNAAAALVDAAKGIVEYQWPVGGTDTDTTGVFYAEFEVTWGDGRKTTFPNFKHLTVEIIDDLDEQ